MSLGATTEYYRSGLADDSLKDQSVAAYLRGKAAGGLNRSTASPVAEHVPEGASSTPSTSEGASPEGRRSRNTRSEGSARVAGLDRSRGSSRSIDTEVAVLASDIAASFTCTRAEARERVLPRSVDSGRSRHQGDEATLLEPLCRSAEEPRGFHRGSWKLVGPPKWEGKRPSARGMPPVGEPPKWSADARHAAGIRRHLPWGSVPFGV